jgi:hypothetical protein
VTFLTNSFLHHDTALPWRNVDATLHSPRPRKPPESPSRIAEAFVARIPSNEEEWLKQRQVHGFDDGLNIISLVKAVSESWKFGLSNFQARHRGLVTFFVIVMSKLTCRVEDDEGDILLKNSLLSQGHQSYYSSFMKHTFLRESVNGLIALMDQAYVRGHHRVFEALLLYGIDSTRCIQQDTFSSPQVGNLSVAFVVEVCFQFIIQVTEKRSIICRTTWNNTNPKWFVWAPYFGICVQNSFNLWASTPLDCLCLVFSKKN